MRALRAVVPTPELLRAALDGSGPALLTTDDPRVVEAVRPQDGVDDEVAVVVPTSGSTGAPKGVLLTADALHASARASAERVGSGRWLLAIPATHVGGLQVLVRSLLAGSTPAVLPAGPFTPQAFAAVRGCTHTSLVPTQLRRLLPSPDGVAALRTYEAVLLGGAAAPAALLERARQAGVRVVTTYGMSETSGGCVYDGVPLTGLQVQARADGRVRLRGPVLAAGYRDGTPLRDADGWFTTGDVGVLHGVVLDVQGRADDVIVTGGEKVAPAAVEAVLAALPGVVEVAVVGVPDDEWGARVVAYVVGRLDLREARVAVAEQLFARAVPREVRHLDALPLLANGKVDRRALDG